MLSFLILCVCDWLLLVVAGQVARGAFAVVCGLAVRAEKDAAREAPSSFLFLVAITIVASLLLVERPGAAILMPASNFTNDDGDFVQTSSVTCAAIYLGELFQAQSGRQT